MAAELVMNKEDMNQEVPLYISKYVRLRGICLEGPQTTELITDENLPKAAGHHELPLKEEFLPELIY